MIDRKLTLLIARFPYGGNGGTSSEVHQIANWLARLAKAVSLDPRIEQTHLMEFIDTPITMTRNAAVLAARELKADVLLMIDSDMVPDCEPGAPNFWNTSFDFLYKHWEKGPCVVAAPYCGPPPHENVYIFRWASYMNDAPDKLEFKLDQYGREEAASLTGITPVAALPTGLILYDMRVFELTEPTKVGRPWFYYEYPDVYEAKKDSTEDVTNTRNISVAGRAQLGYNPIYCNWDCWAGHTKPKVVRKPRPIYVDDVASRLTETSKSTLQRGQTVLDVGGGMSLTPEQMKKLESGDADIRLSCIAPNSEAVSGPSLGNPVAETLARLKQGDVSMMTDEERAELLYLARSARKKAGRFSQAIEVGCWVGEGSKLIAAAFGYNSNVYCVDTWEGTKGDATGDIANGYLYDAFRMNTSEYKNIKPMRLNSLQASDRLADDLWADFILIDAEHTYDACLADLRAWWPKLRPGGTFVVHDFEHPSFPGVAKAVREFFGELGIWKESLAEQKTNTLWWIEKPKAQLRSAIQAREDELNQEYLATLSNGHA